jgi:intracellular sulfur oxidation DsrE/DsrF family protein
MISLLLALCLAALFAGTTQAAESENKPFAERRVVLQISEDSVQRQTLVLNVANNLIRHYGPDKVDVEIVAFGPGLNMLVMGNPNDQRINSLALDNGVRFAACLNTFSNMTRTLGHEPELNANAVKVNAGVVRMMDLVDEGYVLIRP